jgi:hypothetical protein
VNANVNVICRYLEEKVSITFTKKLYCVHQGQRFKPAHPKRLDLDDFVAIARFTSAVPKEKGNV